MKNAKNFGFAELSEQEMSEVDGGGFLTGALTVLAVAVIGVAVAGAVVTSGPPRLTFWRNIKMNGLRRRRRINENN
jgi:hypothetical protein